MADMEWSGECCRRRMDRAIEPTDSPRAPLSNDTGIARILPAIPILPATPITPIFIPS